MAIEVRPIALEHALKTFTSLVAAVSFLSLVGCGGMTPEQACKEGVTVDCNKSVECGTATDAASCISLGQGLCGLVGSLAPAGYVEKQTKCNTDIKAQTCDARKAGKPASCASSN